MSWLVCRYCATRFRRIIQDLNAKHQREIRKEQSDKKKLENLLRSCKASSYAATFLREKLDALSQAIGKEIEV